MLEERKVGESENTAGLSAFGDTAIVLVDVVLVVRVIEAVLLQEIVRSQFGVRHRAEEHRRCTQGSRQGTAPPESNAPF